MWWLYELLLIIGLLVLLPRAVWRRRLPHRGWAMRLGRFPDSVMRTLGEGRHVWVHAVSVGEVQAARPLIDALVERFPGEGVVLSTITPSGFGVATSLMASHGIPIYFPLDLRPCVVRALRVIRPRLLLLMESELWPATIHQAKMCGVPVAVVNGRISERAFRRYRRVRPLLRRMLGEVDLFLMQSKADADRLIALGTSPRKVQVLGSLKWDASISARPTPEELRAEAARIGLKGTETVIVAGSTHRGEEEAVLQAFLALRGSARDVRLILAPRHMERVAEVEGLVRQTGLSAHRLSQEASGGTWQVGVVDSFGQLARYYGLATVVFIGGSLVPHGGQNPLEAASLGKPVLFGPSMHNFADIANQLLTHQAARQIGNGTELATVLTDCLRNRAAAQAMGDRAQVLTHRSQGVTRRTLEALQPFLTGPPPTT